MNGTVLALRHRPRDHKGNQQLYLSMWWLVKPKRCHWRFFKSFLIRSEMRKISLGQQITVPNVALWAHFRKTCFFLCVYVLVNLAMLQMVWKLILFHHHLALSLFLSLSLSEWLRGAVIVISVTQFCQHVPDCSIRKGKQDVRVEQSLKLQNLVNINTWPLLTLSWYSLDHFETSVHQTCVLQSTVLHDAHGDCVGQWNFPL